MNSPPRVDPPNPQIYKLMGGDNMFRLLHDVYNELSKSNIKDIFPNDPQQFADAADKSACFFIGLCGGPALYHQRYGNPMFHRRHFPFPNDALST